MPSLRPQYLDQKFRVGLPSINHITTDTYLMTTRNLPRPNKIDALRRIRECDIPIHQVIDVGVQYQTWELIAAFPDKRQHLFEPASIYFPHIKRFYENIDYALYPFALAGDNQKKYMVVSSLTGDGIPGRSEILENPVEPDGRTVISCSPIELRRFFDLDIDVSQDLLLKVDVDGMDLEVLKGFGEKLQLASVIIVESTADNMPRLIAYVAGAGFELFDICDLCYYGPAVYQVDLVFVRKDAVTPRVRPSIMQFDQDIWTAFAQ